ncbi:hypothetical protein L1987_21849 [Smallanthus sonchifolius]|uniref:Uncharacterized protein n=1 Tax=Smallanthus sonchifolius TaxID=185202 RepID=A0ACB9IEQ7_9ASTR|nr:hypothetical protein L1987_21849 [Smallanthus sonchifolius]
MVSCVRGSHSKQYFGRLLCRLSRLRSPPSSFTFDSTPLSLTHYTHTLPLILHPPTSSNPHPISLSLYNFLSLHPLQIPLFLLSFFTSDKCLILFQKNPEMKDQLCVVKHSSFSRSFKS